MVLLRLEGVRHINEPWYLKTVYLMGFPVGCIDDGCADDRNESWWLERVIHAMGFGDVSAYINTFPGQLRTGIMYETMLNDLEAATDTSPLALLLNSTYFQCLETDVTWGKSTTLFKERYEVILREDPHGCMFLLRPSVGYIHRIKGLEKDTTFDHWFCENWYDI